MHHQYFSEVVFELLWKGHKWPQSAEQLDDRQCLVIEQNKICFNSHQGEQGWHQYIASK